MLIYRPGTKFLELFLKPLTVCLEWNSPMVMSKEVFESDIAVNVDTIFTRLHHYVNGTFDALCAPQTRLPSPTLQQEPWRTGVWSRTARNACCGTLRCPPCTRSSGHQAPLPMSCYTRWVMVLGQAGHLAQTFCNSVKCNNLKSNSYCYVFYFW